LSSQLIENPSPSTDIHNSDFGHSRKELPNRRGYLNDQTVPTQDDSQTFLAQDESSIEVPKVPPLPSPFDPNYATIMESRHKMLLSRQRALLHRRATRDKVQPAKQSGFFVRTHPERPTRVAQVDPTLYLAQQTPANTMSLETPSTIHRSNYDEPWEAFGPADHSQKTFDALIRPSTQRLPGDDVVVSQKTRHGEMRQKSIPALRTPSHQPLARENSKQHSIFSKIKSTLGINNDYRATSQSEAVIARITAVRAARMKRYYEKNSVNLSYRQRSIDRSAMRDTNTGFSLRNASNTATSMDHFGGERPGNKFYTSESNTVDDQSLSTSSNAVDYAANLIVD